MNGWIEIVYVCAFVCVCVGLIGGFQTQEHSSGTEDPVLAAPHQRGHVLRHTHIHTPSRFVAQSNRGRKWVLECDCKQINMVCAALCVCASSFGDFITAAHMWRWIPWQVFFPRQKCPRLVIKKEKKLSHLLETNPQYNRIHTKYCVTLCKFYG